MYSSGASATLTEKETGGHTGINTLAGDPREINVGDGAKVVCGQQFRHSRDEETPRRGAGAQEDEETNNNGSS